MLVRRKERGSHGKLYIGFLWLSCTFIFLSAEIANRKCRNGHFHQFEHGSRVNPESEIPKDPLLSSSVFGKLVKRGIRTKYKNTESG